jgi:hypothetical protein
VIPQIIPTSNANQICVNQNAIMFRSWTVGSIWLCGSWTFPSKIPENNYWAPKNVRLGRWCSFWTWLWVFSGVNKVAVPQLSFVIPGQTKLGCPMSSSTYQRLQAPSLHLKVYTPSSVVENSPFNMVTPSYNKFIATWRNLESRHWVSNYAFNLISWRGNLK